MSEIVSKKSYAEVSLREHEILRYARCGEDIPEELRKILGECINDCKKELKLEVCWKEVNITRRSDSAAGDFYLDECKVSSENLAKMLEGYDKALIFAATAGMGLDKLARKYSLTAPEKAVFVQAIGAEAVEALCDKFCEELSEKYESVTPRFSPGYGDLALEFQRDMDRMLSMRRNIGVTLGANLFMVPTKSVTAIMGVR